MTTEEFEQWLVKQDKEYEKLHDLMIENGNKVAAAMYIGMSNAYKSTLYKYKSILPPPTTLN